MATGNMVPYSNPAGNNQTTPGAGTGASTTTAKALPGATSTVVTSTNPLVPATASSSNTSVPTGTQPATSANGAFGQQLNDIYGALGGEIGNFLGSISGTDSAIMQEYVQSLQPQMATAQANTNAALGAGGVSANSSVTALADANLQSQEFSSISSEEAKLTEQNLQLTDATLMDMAPTAASETADNNAMPWEIAGSIISSIPGGSGIGNGLSSVGSNEANAAGSGSSSESNSMQGLDTDNADFGGW